MEIKLRSLHLKNFKGVRDFSITPNGRNCSIRGQRKCQKHAVGWEKIKRESTQSNGGIIMCLGTVDEKTRKVSKGYKVYRKVGRLFSSISYPEYSRRLRKNRWIEDSQNTKIVGWQVLYQCGFHIFTNKKQAKRLCGLGKVICEVKVDPKSIVASGKQLGANIIVARRIKIVREIKTDICRKSFNELLNKIPRDRQKQEHYANC